MKTKNLSIPELRICLLAAHGFYAKTVQRVVLRSDGYEYSLSTIYRVVKEAGFRFRDYREGEGPEAARTLRKIAAQIRSEFRKAAPKLKLTS